MIFSQEGNLVIKRSVISVVMIMEYFQLLPSQQNVRLSRMILFEGGLSILLRYIAIILKRIFRILLIEAVTN